MKRRQRWLSIYIYLYGLKKERSNVKWRFPSVIALGLREREREDDEEFVFFSAKGQ